MGKKLNVTVSVDIKEAEQFINDISETMIAANELQSALDKFNLAIQSLQTKFNTKTSCQDNNQ